MTVLLAGGFIACEKGMSIALTKDSNPPSFKLSGSGRLFFFSVSEVPDATTASSAGSAIWEIRPNEEDLIAKLPEITYGVAPAAFSQTVPKTGAPPLLAEGTTYQAGGPGLDADGGWIRFTIKAGKTVVISSGHEAQFRSHQLYRTFRVASWIVFLCRETIHEFTRNNTN